MKPLVYVGEFAAVEVPVDGRAPVRARLGEVAEYPDDLADRLGERGDFVGPRAKAAKDAADRAAHIDALRAADDDGDDQDVEGAVADQGAGSDSDGINDDNQAGGDAGEEG